MLASESRSTFAVNFILTNPAGLWALAAVPVVVLIYFLQERTRRVRVSTLFLLERMKPESIGGAKFERLRHSWPMWLQILACIILAWILSGPRWVRADATQDIALVLDSSASMQAFRAETRALLEKKISDWRIPGVITRWHLLETNPRAAALYSGTDSAQMMKALASWQPGLGTHAPLPAINTARALVRNRAGGIILVTDHDPAAPADVFVISAAAPKENCGLIGVTTTGEGADATWRVLARNYSAQPQQREWWVESPDAAAKEEPKRRAITLPPGGALALEGAFVPGMDRCEIVLSGDAFTLDDRLPIVRTIARKVLVGFSISPERAAIMRRVLSAVDGVDLISDVAPDLLIGPWEGAQGESLAAPSRDEILLPRPLTAAAKLDSTWITAEDHALVRDLNWMPLLGPAPREMKLGEHDAPLLWRGTQPLAALRDWGAHKQLVLNIDIENSNADRVPAFILLMHRFIDETRARLPGERAMNVECGQLLKLPALTNATHRAPMQPGFFEIHEGKTKLLHAAAHFADAREADLSAAAPLDTTSRLKRESRLANSEDDHWRPLWIMLAALCLIGAWAMQSHKQAGTDASHRMLRTAD